MSEKDGGSAFPCSAPSNMPQGMTLRDYFAAHAPPMPDDWASLRRHDYADYEAAGEELLLDCQWRWMWADAMLAAREAGKAVSS